MRSTTVGQLFPGLFRGKAHPDLCVQVIHLRAGFFRSHIPIQEVHLERKEATWLATAVGRVLLPDKVLDGFILDEPLIEEYVDHPSMSEEQVDALLEDVRNTSVDEVVSNECGYSPIQGAHVWSSFIDLKSEHLTLRFGYLFYQKVWTMSLHECQMVSLPDMWLCDYEVLDRLEEELLATCCEGLPYGEGGEE